MPGNPQRPAWDRTAAHDQDQGSGSGNQKRLNHWCKHQSNPGPPQSPRFAQACLAAHDRSQGGGSNSTGDTLFLRLVQRPPPHRLLPLAPSAASRVLRSKSSAAAEASRAKVRRMRFSCTWSQATAARPTAPIPCADRAISGISGVLNSWRDCPQGLQCIILVPVSLDFH